MNSNTMIGKLPQRSQTPAAFHEARLHASLLYQRRTRETSETTVLARLKAQFYLDPGFKPRYV